MNRIISRDDWRKRKRKRKYFRLCKEIIRDFIFPLIMGISSIVVAINANRLSEMQALIAKNAEAPTIHIQEQLYDSKSVIEIFLLNGKFKNFKSEIITFLKCDSCDSVDMVWTVLDTYELPIVDYYDTKGNYGEKYALIEEYCCNDFYDSYNELKNSLEKIYNEREGLTLSTSFQTYIKVSYLNLLNEQEEAYQFVKKNIP